MEVADMSTLVTTLVYIETGNSQPRGFYPRVFPVRGPLTLATGFPWNNR
jgi:hypothetical protein